MVTHKENQGFVAPSRYATCEQAFDSGSFLLRIIGIDPGVSRTGYAVLERRDGESLALEVGVIETTKALPLAKRLAELRSHLAEVLAMWRPEAAAVERVFFNANVKTAMATGQASGVILECASEHGLEVFDYTPSEVKLSVVGVGSATKVQVQTMVTRVLKLTAPPQQADAADACALGICHLNRNGLRRAIEAAG